MKRVLTLLTILCCLLGAGLPDAQLAVAEVTNATKADKMALGQGSAFEVGGYGTSLGQFKQLRDITFDRANRLRTLEGRYAVDSSINASDTTTVAGNLRIQKFDAAGNAVSQISLADASLGIHNEPKRLAALDDDTLFVTIPRAGVVKRIAPNGSFLPNIPIPRAFAITRVLFAGSSQERIAVVGNGKSGITNGTLVPETQIHIINPDTGSVVPISLTRNGAPFSLTNALDMAADSQGYFYILAAVNRIYKFSPAGVFLRFIGSGTNGGLVNAGSEFLHTVTVDADGNIYTMSWGNPGLVTQFNSDVTIMRTRPAQYEYAKSWSSHSGYTPLQFDRAGRLWAGVTKEESTTPVLGRYPGVVRAAANLLDPDVPGFGTLQRSALLIGLNTSLTIPRAHNVSYDLTPINCTLNLAAGERSIDTLTINWRAQDAMGAVVQSGTFSLDASGTAPRQAPLSFTPPRFNHYRIAYDLVHNGTVLETIDNYMLVTPVYEGMKKLTAADVKGAFVDPPRQAFAGLPSVRLTARAGSSPADLTAKIAAMSREVDRALAADNRCTVYVQFEDYAAIEPAVINAYMNALKDRVTRWEIINEPDQAKGNTPAQHFPKYIAAAQVIKANDSQALVMGPAVCGIKKDWYEAFVNLQFNGVTAASVTDIWTFHDYEGDESIDPGHWRSKLRWLRALMASKGDAGKQLWQTERCIAGVRGGLFMGIQQAIRYSVHLDLLQIHNIPPEHANEYYTNESGYNRKPTYYWSSTGPHQTPGITRTRAAMTSAKIRAYAGELDFGPTGNELFMGLKFSGANGHTVLLRNLGMRDTPLSFGVNSGASVTVVDSWGNETVVPVLDGTVAISLSQSPKYVLLSSTQTLTPPVFNYGSNLAPRAALEYSAPTVGKKSLSQVNNAVRETIHDGDNRFLWTGAMPQNADGTQIPQTLKATFAKPYVVDRSVIAGQRADNPHSLLLDFDLEGYRNGTRVLRVVVTTPFPQTELGRGRETTAVSWLQDNNIHALSFAPVEVDEMRLVVKRVTHGFAPDLVAAANVLRTWGHVDPPLLELKEWEIYGTPTDNALIGSGDGLQATYYPTVTLTGTPVVQVDPVINITSAPLGPLKGDNWSVRWQGYVQAEYSEDYTFFINMNDGARLWINDVQVINQWKGHSVHTEYSVTVPLVAGQKVPIRMEFYKGPSAGVAQLKWSGTSTPKQIVPQSQLYSTAGGATGGTSAPPVVEEGDLMGQWMSQGNGRYKARHTMPVAAGSKLEFVYDAPPVG